MYFYELWYSFIDRTHLTVYSSDKNISEEEFKSICQSIFDKYAIHSGDESWIEMGSMDWDEELLKYGFKPLKVNGSFMADCADCEWEDDEDE